MCHMFLVPVFETGSLRTFQLSTHKKNRGRGRYTEKESEEKGKESVRNEKKSHGWTKKTSDGEKKSRDG